MRNTNFDSTKLVTTNEERFSGTQSFLQEKAKHGEWDEISKQDVFVVELPDGHLAVVDGNHRVDVARQQNLPLPNIQVIENDADVRQLIQEKKIAYTKVTSVDQLRNLVARRVQQPL